MSGEDQSSTGEGKKLVGALSLYGINSEALRSIGLASKEKGATRAAALALWWRLLNERSASLQQEEKVDIQRELALFLEVVNEANEQWLTRALVKGVLSKASETDDGAINCVSKLLERCAEGGKTVEDVIELLQIWRERSSAPVNAKQAINQWLSYTFQ